MRFFDLKKRIITAAHPRHSLHGRYLELKAVLGRRRTVRRARWSAVFALTIVAIIGLSAFGVHAEYLTWTYRNQSEIQNLRLAQLNRYRPLPIEQSDPKFHLLVEYLEEKNSPLAAYAGELARMPNWKLLVGIAQAESNMCKRTNRNNCWGIGPGSPWTFEDITQSMYYADSLLSKYRTLGMDRPENMVRTYVGWHNPNWVLAIHNVLSELSERGLQ